MSARGRISFAHVIVAAAVLLLPLATALATPPPSTALGEIVWSAQYSADYRTDSFQDVACGPDGAIYCAGITKATDEVSTLLLVKYVDQGATSHQEWAQTYKLPGTTGSRATEVEVDKSGNVIVAGTVGVAPPASAKGRNIIVLKYSAGGTFRWRNVYDGPGHKDDSVTGMKLDTSGDVYVSGASRGAGTGRDYVTIKVRSGGTKAWVKRYSGSAGADEARGIAVDSSGNAYVTGVCSLTAGRPRAVTIKYSAAGNRRWLRTYRGSSGGAYSNAIAVRRVSGTTRVFVAGSMWNGNAEGSDALFIKYAAGNGATVWRHTMGNGDMYDESAQELAIDPHGGPVAVGATRDENNGYTHGFIAGFSTSGSAPWSDEYWSGGVDNDARFQALALDAGGSVYAGGWAETAGGGTDFAVRYLFRLIGPGNWGTVIDGTAHGDDICRAVVVGPDGAYAAGEATNVGSGTDALLVKF